MNHQMFPPNHFDSSFEWFRNQQQLKDHYFNNGTFNRNDMNQQQYEMIQRYYGNMIQPYSQDQIQAADLPQSVQMIETSPFSAPSTVQTTNHIEEIHQNGYEEPGTMFGNPTEYNHIQPQAIQNPSGQYPTQFESSHPGYGQQPHMPNYSNFQMYSNPYGNQNYHTQFPPNYTQQPPQQGQMIQGQGGPFSTPSMFAPSTPYPTQPKQLNQQSSNSQSFQISSILNQFKNTSGSYDVPKMMSTAGQMMNTMNQVGGLFKQIGFFFK